MNRIEKMSVSDFLRISEDPGRNIFIRPEVGLIKSTNVLTDSEYRDIEVFRASDYQRVIVREGLIEIECNLQAFSLSPGNVLVFSPGTLICTKRKSANYDATVIYLQPDAVGIIQSFDYRVISTINTDILSSYVSVIMALLAMTKRNTPVTLAVQSFLIYLLEEKQNEIEPQHRTDRRSHIFKSFIKLLNEDGRHHHLSSYYSDTLCVSLNYMNDIVKEKSGRTVYQWINEYLITEAKAMLFHSSDTIQQISDYLNFPNPAFFSRFFKQHTGLTPLQFRKHM